MSNKKCFYTNVTKRGNKILMRGYIEDGDDIRQVQQEVPFQPCLYIQSDGRQVDAHSIKGLPLARVDFDDMKGMSEFQERYKDVMGFKTYGMKKPVYQFISKYFPGEIAYAPEAVRGAILDIEVFSGEINADGTPVAGPFPREDLAQYPINAITVYSTQTKTFYTFGLETFNDHKLGTFDLSKLDPEIQEKLKDLTIEYRGFNSEKELLEAFLQLWESSCFDWYSGWNSRNFDITYIVNRLKNTMGEKAAKRLSPWGLVYSKTEKDDFGNERQNYDLIGISELDMKSLFEKHGFIQPLDWKLNTVAQLILGEAKLSFEEAGSLNTLYVINYAKFIAYNIVDVDLVVRMDEKKQFMMLTYTLAYITKSNFEDTRATVAPWSALLYDMLQAKGVQVEIKTPQPITESIMGGFVKSPKPGRYRWIMNGDYNSLYPHIMQMFNLGPETLLEPDEVPLEVRNAIPMNFTIDDLLNKRIDLSILKKYNLTMTANRQFFKRENMSCLNEKTREIYTSRATVKKQMKKFEQERENAPTKAEKARLDKIIAPMDTRQLAFKILMNAGYGALSNRFFTEFYDKRIAEGITSSGQLAITWVGRKLDEYFAKLYGTGEVTHRYYRDGTESADIEVKGKSVIVYQDTDSVYFDMSPLVDKMFGENPDPDKVTAFLDRVFEEKIQKVIDDACNELADYMNAHENRLFMKRENIAPGAIWTGKKRYAMLVTNSEGVKYETPKLKIVGLDAVQGKIPERSRNWLKECYKVIMLKDEKDLHSSVKDIRTQFMKLKVEDIAENKTTNAIEKYMDSTTIYAKGCPKHVRAAIYHNLMIERKSVTGVQKINSGEKIMFVPLKKNNPQSMDVIGFQSYLPKAFGLDSYVDYDSTFQKNFVEPLNNILKAVGWTHEPVASVKDFWS